MSDDGAANTAVRELGGAENVDELMSKYRAAVTPGGEAGAAAAVKLAQATASDRFVNWTTTYWMNAILSGPLTWAVNSMSGLMMSVYRPLEAMLGAGAQLGVAKLTGQSTLKQSELWHDSMREIIELAMAAPEAFRAARKVLSNGENLLDPARKVADVVGASRRNVIAAKNAPIDLSAKPGLAHAVDWIGRQVDIPSRILAAQDEFTKQMVYRSTARTAFRREAMQLGLGPEALSAHIVKRMEQMIRNDQAYSSATVFKQGVETARAQGITNPDAVREFAKEYAAKNFDRSLNETSQRALRNAEDVTFTRALDDNSVSAKIQAIPIAHPMWRFVLPFVRTPLNILKFTGQRFDGIGIVKGFTATRFPAYARSLEGSRNRFIKEILSDDERVKADAIGRVIAGASFATAGLSLGAAGIITGRGPSDPEQRRLLEQSGWMPYSIKTPEGYISYARVEPFATAIGIFADMYDVNRLAPIDKQDTIETIAKGIGIALANNFTNKTYLTGIGNFVEAAQAPDRKVATWFQRYAASFVPNTAGQLTRVGDESMRDVRGMVDALMAKIPGLSEDLAPARNLLGEPIRRAQSAGSDSIGSVMNILLPVAYREVSNSEVSRELASLEYGFSPPKTDVNGLDLLTYKGKSGQTAYDRWAELHGEVKLGGRTLEAELRRTFKSANYQRLSPDSTEELDSPRIAVVKRIVGDYRRAAYKQMLREFPDVKQAERMNVRTKQQLKQGRDTRFLTQ
jgi:hypothetical protein